mgnify:CR=1 FL=1
MAKKVTKKSDKETCQEKTLNEDKHISSHLLIIQS